MRLCQQVRHCFNAASKIKNPKSKIKYYTLCIQSLHQVLQIVTVEETIHHERLEPHTNNLIQERN